MSRDDARRLRITDVGAFLGITQQRAQQMWREGKLPKPNTVDGLGHPLWTPATIERWAERHWWETRAWRTRSGR